MATDKKIKIFVDAHGFDTPYQGVQSFLLHLYNGLLQHYPQLDIYMGAYNTDRIRQAFPLLPADHILPYQSLRPAAIRFVRDIPRLLKRHCFDFAHFQYIAPRPQLGCQYIVTLHDVLFKDYPHSFSWGFRQSRTPFFANSIRKAAIKTTVSAYAQERISHHYQIPLAQLQIIPNAIAPLCDTIPNREKAIELVKAQHGIDNFILYVSRIEPRKNHLLLLQTWLELELYNQGIALVFIGSSKDAGRKSAPLFKVLRQLPTAARPFFRHIEQVDGQWLPIFLRAARLFVYPSIAEGFGIPPLEAAVAGTPVLCSNATAMQEFGFFKNHCFAPHDKQVLKVKMLNRLHQPPAAEQLTAIAEQVLAQYAPQRSAAIFYNLLNQYMP